MNPISRTRGWRGAGTLAAVLLAATLLVVCAVTPPADADAGVTAAGTLAGKSRLAGSITWSPCDEDPAAECGTVTVPIDWDQPWGETVDLAVVRRKATDPAARLGALVINPGGPGGSGVDAILYAYQTFPANVYSRYDLVGFDPRGVGRSHPIVCSRGLDSLPSPVVTSQTEFDRAVTSAQRLGEDCRRRTGPLFDHVDTLSVVHDVDAIRAALGEPKIAFYGYSYGTQVGLQYAEVYGDRLQAMVVDSVVDHSVRNPELLTSTSAAGEDSFDEFAAWCERSAACVLHDKGIRPVWRRLSARAAAGTLRSPYDSGRDMATYELTTMVRALLTGPYWSGLAKIMSAMDSGATIDISQSRLEAPVATLAISCQDWDHSVRNYRDYMNYVGKAWRVAGDVGPSPDNLSETVWCVRWPAKVVNPQHRLRITAAPKIIVVNSLHDPATGYAWAQNVMRQLGDKAVLVTYEGWGHGNYDWSPCTLGVLVSYLTENVVPAGNVRCPAIEPSLEYQESILAAA